MTLCNIASAILEPANGRSKFEKNPLKEQLEETIYQSFIGRKKLAPLRFSIQVWQSNPIQTRRKSAALKPKLYCRPKFNLLFENFLRKLLNLLIYFKAKNMLQKNYRIMNHFEFF